MGQDCEIASDGRTVWVNGPDGVCLGRFSRFGVDVHRNMKDQLETGQQCLACSHDRPDAEEWERFVALMLLHHRVTVGDVHRPDFIEISPGPKP